MWKLFSQRNVPLPSELSYDIPDEVRKRILYVFNDNTSEGHSGFSSLFEKIEIDLLKRYGNLSCSSYNAGRRHDEPVIEHFLCCDDHKAIDFIEVCFKQLAYPGNDSYVKEINEIFQETGVGYEFTPLVEHHVGEETFLFGHKRQGNVIKYEYPRAIRREHQLLHKEIISQSLQLLSDNRLRVVNSEMLKAHSALRDGLYEDVITKSGSAFESFLKTTCKIKNWPYDEDKDSCKRLIDICREHNLFPKFYVPAFESVGTIRNKLGDVHGRGPSGGTQVKREYAEHMLHVTSAHMLFLAKMAGLS